MASKSISQYTQQQQMEPLMPQQRLDELLERARDVVEKSLRLKAAHTPQPIQFARTGTGDELLLFEPHRGAKYIPQKY